MGFLDGLLDSVNKTASDIASGISGKQEPSISSIFDNSNKADSCWTSRKPLYDLYVSLRAMNFNVPNDYDSFERMLTVGEKNNEAAAAQCRHKIYEEMVTKKCGAPNTYSAFYSVLFEPISKTASRAKSHYISDVQQSKPADASQSNQSFFGSLSDSISKAVDDVASTIGDVAGDVAKTVSDAASVATSTIGQWADDFLGLIVIKLRELVGQIDFNQTIADVEKVGKEKDIDVAPMVKFLKQLQDFAANGQENK